MVRVMRLERLESNTPCKEVGVYYTHFEDGGGSVFFVDGMQGTVEFEVAGGVEKAARKVEDWKVSIYGYGEKGGSR
jgi:hypothetical protein